MNPYKEFFRGLTAFGVKPLIIITGINFIFVFMLLLGSIGIILLKAVGLADQGWSSLAVIPIAIGFMTVSTQAIHAIYLGRIYQQVQKRPNIIIREDTLVETE